MHRPTGAEAGASASPEAIITGHCDMPDIGAGYQNWVLS